MRLYVVGHIIEPTDKGPVWDILGVFDSKAKAETVCHDEWCFVGPMYLNDDQGPELCEWEGVVFPKMRD